MVKGFYSESVSYFYYSPSTMAFRWIPWGIHFKDIVAFSATQWKKVASLASVYLSSRFGWRRYARSSVIPKLRVMDGAAHVGVQFSIFPYPLVHGVLLLRWSLHVYFWVGIWPWIPGNRAGWLKRKPGHHWPFFSFSLSKSPSCLPAAAHLLPLSRK